MQHALYLGPYAQLMDEGEGRYGKQRKLPFSLLIVSLCHRRPDREGRAPPVQASKKHTHPRLGRAELYFCRGRDERDLSGTDTARAPKSAGRGVGDMRAEKTSEG